MNEAILKKYNLQGNLNLFAIEYSDEEQWLAERRRGIGGSDVGALMGISKYSSPLKVYKSKVEPQDQLDTVNVRKGKDLEPVIRDNYVTPYLKMRGYRVEHPDVMLVNNSCPWLIANLDGIAVPLEPASYRDNIVVEIKWVSEYGEARWGGDAYGGVPPEYYAQVQHYMCVTGCQNAIICALFDSTWEMHYYEIPFDMTFVMKMLDTSQQFYEHNMAHKIAPPPDIEIDREEIAEELAESGDPIETMPCVEMTEICAEYTCLKEEIKEKEATLRDLGNKILKLRDDGFVPEKPFKVRVTTYPRASFDQVALRKELPEVHAKFTRIVDCLRIHIGK